MKSWIYPIMAGTTLIGLLVLVNGFGTQINALSLLNKLIVLVLTALITGGALWLGMRDTKP